MQARLAHAGAIGDGLCRGPVQPIEREFGNRRFPDLAHQFFAAGGKDRRGAARLTARSRIWAVIRLRIGTGGRVLKPMKLGM